MRLVIVRHGIAGERGPEYPDDRLRPLTPEGRARMSEAALGLARVTTPDVILTSPWLRAEQTAAIIGSVFRSAQIRRTASLASSDVEQVLEDVARSGAEVVCCVGHEPWLGELLSAAVGGGAFEFKKGASASVVWTGRATPGTGVLEWFLPPRVLRDVGRSPR